jgi:hypothetical protein
MVYGRTPFAHVRDPMQKMHAIANQHHRIHFPANVEEAAIDTMKLCLRYKAEDRAPILGPNGLLNAHRFLNATSNPSAATPES